MSLWRSFDLCPNCEASCLNFSTYDHCCWQCGLLLGNSHDAVCGRCLTHDPGYDSTQGALWYDDASALLVHAFKYHNKLAAGRVLGHFMARNIGANLHLHSRPEIIVPVPLHRKRLKQRGFNQSAILAQIVAKKLNMPIAKGLVTRHQNTQAQAHLKGQERINNVRHAFSLARRPGYSHVALVDDVMTTGATVAAIADLLKNAGVNRVDVWVAARRG